MLPGMLLKKPDKEEAMEQLQIHADMFGPWVVVTRVNPCSIFFTIFLNRSYKINKLKLSFNSKCQVCRCSWKEATPAKWNVNTSVTIFVFPIPYLFFWHTMYGSYLQVPTFGYLCNLLEDLIRRKM